jgi:membrane-associated protease RseP (regulator of RpoE activity)
MDTVASPPSQRPLLHLALLFATLVTTLGTFLVMWTGAGWTEAGRWDWSRVGRQEWIASFQFSLSLVAILGSHEMGHWLMARWHRVETSLPYFIPLPLVGFGTLGAVIRIRGRIPTRNALVDIGAGGPLAGFAVALPILFWGYAHGHLTGALVAPTGFPAPDSLLGVLGGLLEPGRETARGAATVFGDNLLTLIIQRVTLGPLPMGTDVEANPFIMAGWFGCLVTVLNLIPIGQLDGGHLSFANLGGRAVGVGKAVALGFLGLVLLFNYFWAAWLLVVTLVVGFRHPEVERAEEPLDAGRISICIACLVIFALCIMPSPLRIVGVP